MADFCNQCAKALGFDFGDFDGLSTADDNANNLYANVLCEGCGPIQVDYEGNCITKGCLENHNIKDS